MANEFQEAEINDRLGELLPSQYEFVFSPARFSCIAGGFGSGKTRACITKGLILSAKYPGNVGMIARYHGTDLEDSVMPLFFEVCPPSWIKRYNKKTNTIVLKNGSVIIFRHIHDSSQQNKNNAVSSVGPKTRRVGANLGWFFIDQMEEISVEQWLAMISRLRLPKAEMKFGFGSINPNGHDWIWKSFFTQFRPWKRDANGKVIEFYQVSKPAANVLGVAVNSEENRESNGGFIEDAYFDSLLMSYPPEWVERYIYCSFDDFSGKIYKEFRSGLVQIGASNKWEEVDELASVHVIDNFPIPANWELVVGIDPGGAGKWAVTPIYIDETGKLIVAEGFHKKASNVAEVAGWIKSHLPWNQARTRYVIDWENRIVMLELAEYGIHCTPAMKSVIPGILRVGGYMHVQRGARLPDWYMETQPQHKIDKFKKSGCPRVFFLKGDVIVRSEHDTYIWNPNKPNVPYQTNSSRWDSCDSVRYVIMSRPEPSKMADIDTELEELAKKDPLSYREWAKFDERVKNRMYRNGGGGSLKEMDMDEVVEGIDLSLANRAPEYTAEGEV